MLAIPQVGGLVKSPLKSPRVYINLRRKLSKEC
jgi:hypothetical protein